MNSFIEDQITIVPSSTISASPKTDEVEPKWLDKLITENNVIVDVLQNFDYNNDEEVLEARELFERYKTIFNVLQQYDVHYDRLIYRKSKRSRDHRINKKHRILALLGTHCDICGYPVNAFMDRIVHHVVPIHKNGVEDYTNVSVLCPKCHMHLHDITMYPLEAEQIKARFKVNNALYTKFLQYLYKADPSKLTDIELSLIKIEKNKR